MHLVVHSIDWRTALSRQQNTSRLRMGALPAALLRPLPPVPFIAGHFWDCRLPRAWHVLIAKHMEPAGREDGWRRVMRRFLWIKLGRADFSSPYSNWPSLLLHLKSWSQSRSTCRPERSFILLPFWNFILLVFYFGVRKKYGSIVCAWICTVDLSTPSCQHTDTIYSKSERFIAHLPEILLSWTLPGIIIMAIITTTTILAGLQDTALLTHGSSGSQPSALVPLHKRMVAAFCNHSATAPPWSNRSFQQELPAGAPLAALCLWTRASTAPTSALCISLLTPVLCDSLSLLTFTSGPLQALHQE